MPDSDTSLFILIILTGQKESRSSSRMFHAPRFRIICQLCTRSAADFPILAVSYPRALPCLRNIGSHSVSVVWKSAELREIA